MFQKSVPREFWGVEFSNSKNKQGITRLSNGKSVIPCSKQDRLDVPLRIS